MNRLASTRSEVPASQLGSGRAQCSVGSIEGDGIRYGLTIQVLTAKTIRTAPTIVITQSITTRGPCERFGKSRSIGPRKGWLRDGRRELAPDQGHRLQVVVREMLQHDALVADLLDLLQALDRLLDRPDRAVLAVALEDVFRAPSEARTDALSRLRHLLFVPADDAGRHQRVAQGGGIAPAALAGFVEQLLALPRFVERAEQ